MCTLPRRQDTAPPQPAQAAASTPESWAPENVVGRQSSPVDIHRGSRWVAPVVNPLCCLPKVLRGDTVYYSMFGNGAYLDWENV